MTLSNHLLSGALIGSLLPLPIAIPTAFISHFILDTLPHFGFRTYKERFKNVRLFRFVIYADGVIGLIVMTSLLLTENYIGLLTALVAASPDFVWIYRYTLKEKFGRRPPVKKGPLTRFHKNIQWCERKWGLAVELPFAILLAFIVFTL